MPTFVPVVVEAAPAAPVVLSTGPKRRRRTALRPSGGIELEIDGVVVRMGEHRVGFSAFMEKCFAALHVAVQLNA